MLKAERLSYYRDGHPIFSEISFNVEAGTCCFVKGQNGSGKTTLLRILAGHLPIQSGIIHLNGMRISSDRDFISQNIDYIGHRNSIKKQMTALENLKFWNNIFASNKQIDFGSNFEDRMVINRFRNKLISFCSVGQTRRVALSRLNTSERKLWLIDEPTTSLDHYAVKNFGEMIEDHCLHGGAAIIATHSDINMPKIVSKSITLGKITHDKTYDHDPFLDGDW